MRDRTGRGDFVRMGQAIVSRWIRCAKWWEPHLTCSRSFLKQNIRGARNVAVFGAGRLLDLDLKLLLDYCDTVHLFDADAGCLDIWKRTAASLYGKRVLARVEDCTDCLDHWTVGARALRRGESLGEFLNACQAPLPSWASEGFDGVISLNILGQIPLYWRDRIRALKPDLSDLEWLDLTRSMAQLQRAHLEGILTLRRAWSILLTDTEYYFYHADESSWRSEPALFAGVPEALKVIYAGMGASEAWLWHIAPQYVESDDEGEIHRVEAFFRAESSIHKP